MIAAMSCLAIIRTARDSMSANEKKLADFILENASLIRDYSSQQLAGSVGVSQSSVVKFSQKLGYKGFTDLKLAVHESVVVQSSNVSQLRGEAKGDEDERSIKDWLFARKRDAISATAAINGNRALQAAVDAIESAARILLIGVGDAHLAARDLGYKLTMLGKPVIAEGDADVQKSCIPMLNRGDCLIVISASGKAPGLVELAKSAKRAGVALISLTDQGHNPLGAVATIRLYSVAGGGRPDISKLVAAASQQHVIDLTVFLLTQRARNSDPARSALRKGFGAPF
jgi:DNA-binding MurR/RpiR family transcriptional regulator